MSVDNIEDYYEYWHTKKVSIIDMFYELLKRRWNEKIPKLYHCSYSFDKHECFRALS